MPELRRVLFVSKPIAPPWNDGSKNLVRDVASHLARVRPTVMTLEGADVSQVLGDRVDYENIYKNPGKFAPGLLQNARVAGRLMRGDALDLWHFVFAPNPASSSVARVALRARRTLGWKGKVVQTIASAPKSFDGVSRLIFGDRVIALSGFTRGRLIGAGVRTEITVIPPCARAPRELGPGEAKEIRERHGVGDGPVVLYPGDYEVSRGASTLGRAIPSILAAIPETRFIFACRAKTARSADARREIEAEIEDAGASHAVIHLGEVPDMAELLGIADLIAFAVDDLYGKVDLPLVLLEALAVGVPLIVARGGPLESLETARLVDPGDADALSIEIRTLLLDKNARNGLIDAGKSVYNTHYTPEVVARAYDDLYEEMW